MNTLKKCTVIFLACTLLFVTACSSGTASGSSVNESAAKASSQSNTVGTEAPIELEFFHKANEERWQGLCDTYAEENPGVKIKSVAATGDYAPAIGTRIASGSIPDIFMSGTFGDAVLYAPQSELLNDETYWDRVQPSAIASIMDGQNKVALPVQSQSWGLIYNVDVFEKAGIKEVPKTLTELKNVCETLKSQGITPFVAANKTDWTIHQSLLFPISNDAKDDPLGFFEKLNKAEILLKDQAVMTRIADFFDLYKQYLQDKPFSTEFDPACGIIAQGQAAMYLQGDWTEGAITTTNPDAKVAFMPVPFSDDPNDRYIYMQPSIAIHVGKDGKYAAEAKKFLEWMVTSKKFQEFNAEKEVTITPFKDAVAPTKGMLLQSAIKLANENPDMVRIWGEFSVPGKVHVAIEPIDTAYMGNQITTEEWINQLSAEWEKFGKENG